MNASQSSWLVSEFLLAIFASVGGIIVLVGLAMEMYAEKFESREKWDARFECLIKSKHWCDKWGQIAVMFGVFIEVVVGAAFAVRDDLKIRDQEARDAKSVQELRGQNYTTWQLLEQGRTGNVDWDKFANALKGKPKMDVQILYPPDDEHAWWLADFAFSEGFGRAGWVVIDLRPYREDDASSQLSPHNQQTMPLSLKLGSQYARIGLMVNRKEQPEYLFFDTNSSLGAVGAAINLFPLLSAMPAQLSLEDSRLPTNVMRIVIGPGN